MKKLFTILSAVFLTATIWAQSPQKMSYQAVVRDLSNNIVVNHPVGMKISILKGSITGSAVYVEIYNPNPNTNANGLLTIEIGGGIPLTGSFATINWSNDTYFIKSEIDPTGGTNYTITGVSQLLSVPYALHAKTAEAITGTITETDPLFSSSTASAITGTDTGKWTTAFNWGNHSVAGYLKSYTETDPVFKAWTKNYNDLTNKPSLFDGTWSSLTGKPTTLSGYGITDGVNTTGTQTIAGNKTFSNLTAFSNGIKFSDGTTLVTGNLGKWTFADTTNYTNDNVSIPNGSLKVGALLSFDDKNANSHTNQYEENNPNPIIYARYMYGSYGHLILQGNTYYQSSIQFVTGSTPTQRMVVMGNGNVGIGTNSPMRTFHVNAVMRLEPISTAPESPAKGDIYFDNTLNKLRFYNGTTWQTSDTETDPVYNSKFDVTGSTTGDLLKFNGTKYIKFTPNYLTSVDGSETKITAGTNVTVEGSGTTSNPYVINAKEPKILTIGQSYQGGIIFWLDETGQHGLIAATADQGTQVQWHNNAAGRWTGATGGGLYAGKMNTAMIVANHNLDDPLEKTAARLCADYGGGGMGDWYLPSIHELALLYEKKDLVGGFSTNLYWSSDEYSDRHAWFLSFTDGAQLGNEKGAIYGVRAIRSF